MAIQRVVFCFLAFLAPCVAQYTLRECLNYSLNCDRCMLAFGCHYCPGDGLCISDPTEVPNDVLIQSRCKVDEFLAESTCTPNDLYQSASVSDGSDSATPFYSDPLYGINSWVFEQINLIPAWKKGYTGKGIRVRINDSGVEVNHPEFGGRFNINESCRDHLPDYSQPTAPHGTNVASIVGAGGNDGCSVGVAPGVSFSSCNVFDNGAYSLFGVQSLDADIVQNSFGPRNCINGKRRRTQELECPFVDRRQNQYSSGVFPCNICDFSQDTLSNECQESIISHCIQYQRGPDTLKCYEYYNLFVNEGNKCANVENRKWQEIISQGIRDGRGGKGLIYVFASGNSHWLGGDINFDGVISDRFTISVGAVAQDQRRSVFSTGGAGLLVAAPGGSGRFANDFVGAGLNGKCTTISEGTSFAAPVVSGVIALMLEANKDLSWRDVQGILASTSQVPKFLENDGQIEFNSDVASSTSNFETVDATVNGAGFIHSYGYGFGIIDAEAAVTAAEEWKMLTPERMVEVSSEELDETILDSDQAKLESSVNVGEADAGEGFVIESAAVFLSMRHHSHGDLQIVLTSPQGTESILSPGNRDLIVYNSSMWRLMTVRCWGESALGDWTLMIRDLNKSSQTVANTYNQLQQWRLVLYGRGGRVAPFTFPQPPSLSPTGYPTRKPVATIEDPEANNSDNKLDGNSESDIQVDSACSSLRFSATILLVALVFLYLCVGER